MASEQLIVLPKEFNDALLTQTRGPRNPLRDNHPSYEIRLDRIRKNFDPKEFHTLNTCFTDAPARAFIRYAELQSEFYPLVGKLKGTVSCDKKDPQTQQETPYIQSYDFTITDEHNAQLKLSFYKREAYSLVVARSRPDRTYSAVTYDEEMDKKRFRQIMTGLEVLRAQLRMQEIRNLIQNANKYAQDKIDPFITHGIQKIGWYDLKQAMKENSHKESLNDCLNEPLASHQEVGPKDLAIYATVVAEMKGTVDKALKDFESENGFEQLIAGACVSEFDGDSEKITHTMDVLGRQFVPFMEKIYIPSHEHHFDNLYQRERNSTDTPLSFLGKYWFGYAQPILNEFAARYPTEGISQDILRHAFEAEYRRLQAKYTS
jgi:hypothetical protein